jgi:hypothetical protein
MGVWGTQSALFGVRWNVIFTSRDFLRAECDALSKNVTSDVSQSENTLSEVI